MDLLRKPKLEELRSAIQNRNQFFIVIYGPPGSLKTTATTQVCAQFGLRLEYVADISKYKNKLISKNTVCYTDIDNQEFIMRHKHVIEKMRNLIIETRSFQSIWKYLKNCKLIEFRKVCNMTIKKLIQEKEDTKSLDTKNVDTNSLDTKSLEKSLEKIDGNMHRLPFYKYCACIESIDIYRYIGRLFYSKNITDKTIPQFKITNYLFSNSVSFFTGVNLYEIYDNLSLTDNKLNEFYEYSEYLVYSKKKKNTGRQLLKSMNTEDTHVCSTFCEVFKQTK